MSTRKWTSANSRIIARLRTWAPSSPASCWTAPATSSYTHFLYLCPVPSPFTQPPVHGSPVHPLRWTPHGRQHRNFLPS